MADQWEIKSQLVDDPVEPGWEPFSVDIDFLWIKRRVPAGRNLDERRGIPLSELDETE